MDWRKLGALLTMSTEQAFLAFFEKVPRASLCAVGYVFEIGNATPQFFLCANTSERLRSSLQAYRSSNPQRVEDSVRWNSGDYEYPAKLLSRDELGRTWELEYAKVEALFGAAESEAAFGKIYRRLVDACVSSLVDLAARDVFGDWTRLDFNVSETAEPFFVPRARHRHVIRGIRARVRR
ncbi:MAG TPA: DUF4303 domain-containing protein [Planctomycetota bacterium]